MKNILTTYLPTLLRHAFTSLASLGALLATKGLIDSADAGTVDAAGGTLGAALVVIATAILSRLAITLLGKLKISGLVPGATDKAVGLLLWLGMVGLAGLSMFALPGCATTVTTTKLPDGSVVTVTAKSSDPVAIAGALEVTKLLAPTLDRLAAKK